MTRADDLIANASADPRQTLGRSHSYLERLGPDDHEERSKTLRAMSLASRFTNQINESIEYAGRAAVEGSAAGSDELEHLGRLTLSGSLATTGRFDEALDVIEESLAIVTTPDLGARFRFQRGAVLAVLGRNPEAEEAFLDVLPVFRELGDHVSVGLTLNQLGRVLVEQGDLDRAEVCLLEAMELALVGEDNASVPGIEHNLGQLAAYRGDIPTALERLASSDQRYMTVSGASAPQHVARCEVLLGVGLFREALELADRVAAWNHANGDLEHEVNALTVACQAALLARDPTLASRLAGRVVDLLGTTDGSARLQEARRVLTEARFEVDGASSELFVEAETAANELAVSGHLLAADQARLLAGRIAVAMGDTPGAERNLVPLTSVRSGPVEARLAAWVGRALLAMARGNDRGADAAARAGLRLLADYQAALGATDLRMGLDRQGTELGAIGTGLALKSPRPRRVLQWMERTRAGALRLRPVTPERDVSTRRLLEELRRIEAGMREEGGPDPDTARRRRRLQEEIALAHRTTRGGDTVDQVDLDELLSALGPRILIEIGAHQGRLFAVVVAGGRWRFQEMGLMADAMDELAHVRFAMRKAAMRRLPLDPSALDRLDDLLLPGVEPGADVVVVPPPELMAAPWAALPGMRGRTCTVSPSAGTWLGAVGRRDPGGDVLTMAGPDLDHAAAEAAAVGALYPPTRLRTGDSSVGSVGRALEEVSVAHLVCHATFRVENPMFSSLRLGDGDLYVYDIERLSRPPHLVVLSACDSGYTETRAGDELAGLTSALLGIGARDVVASIGLVPDSEATVDLMVGFHQAMLAGMSPAGALSNAQSAGLSDPDRFVAAASFLCIGA